MRQLILVIAVTFVGCSSEPRVCVAGQQVACACPGGAAGAQACADDGSRYLACDCPVAAVDSGTASDAGADAGLADAGVQLPDAGNAVDAGAADAGPPTLVYVNWCPSQCVLSAGADDNRINRSSVINAGATLNPPRGPVLLLKDDAMTCFRALLAPYNVSVTETDPGSAQHVELMIGRASTDLSLPMGLSVVGPFACGGTLGAIGFVFGDVAGTSSAELCAKMGYQLGSLAGLETAFSCPDVMSTLSTCSTKAFTDVDAGCGETTPTACTCGPSQNSDARLRALFGAAP